ncbi:MAG: DUF423 domain-containing protein [Flavobacteriaceae bacterium]|nr:MAG: DUF423 domain-containing protein [Flavobacteriaceae bacterium]
MKQFVLSLGAIYGFLSVALGAFGAHGLKKILSAEKLQSFEVGVRYQLTHALLLLLMGFFLNFQSSTERYAAYFLALGITLFSGSIYVLSFSEKLPFSVKFLGPVTPIGGLFLLLAWASLVYIFAKGNFSN